MKIQSVMPLLRKGSAILCFILLPALSWAQMQHRTPEQRAGMQTKWMQKNLDLNSDQLKEVQDINMKYAQKMEDLMNSSDRAAMRQQRMEMMQNKDDELHNILNSEQFQKYQQKEQEMRQKMRSRMRDGGNMNNGNMQDNNMPQSQE